MSDFKEDEREIHPDAIVLRDLLHAGEAARAMLGSTVTEEGGMSDFKEDPSEWAESDEREIRPDATVLRGQEAQEAGRAVLAWAGHVTDEQLEAAARAIYTSDREGTLPAGFAERSWDHGLAAERDRYLRHARVALEAAGFTVVGEEEA